MSAGADAPRCCWADATFFCPARQKASPMAQNRFLSPRFVTLVGMILAAAVTRLIAHPPNFTPIGALALFGGASFADRRVAFGVPLLALFLGDLVLGFHTLMPAVYASFALIVFLGFWLRGRRRLVPIAGAALACSLLFFVVTNFAVWAQSGSYEASWQGLVMCYVAAVPFFYNTVMGDATYAVALFAGLALAEHAFPRLLEIKPKLA